MGLFGRHNKEREMKAAVNAGTAARDPVCGMDVETDHAAAVSVYQGKTYYFCAAACKNSFEQNPGKYLGGEADTGGHTAHGGHGGHGCCG